MVKVLIIEDHKVIRDGIENMLTKTNHMNIVGSVGLGSEGINLFREKRPDIVLLDYKLPDLNGITIIERLKRYDPKVKIIILTSMENEELTVRLIKLGIAGFVSKNNGINKVEDAIKTVLDGQRYISQDVANKIAFNKADGRALFDELSERELEIALLLIGGGTPQEIAKKLHIEVKTVHSYRYRIFQKLGIIKSDVELFRFALKAGIINIEDI